MGNDMLRKFSVALAYVAITSWVFLLAGPPPAHAGGALKRTPSGEKDEFIIFGEIIFIGSADYWETSYDPEVDAPVDYLATYSSTEGAREYLDFVGIELYASGALITSVNSTSTASGLTTHSIDWFKVSVGELEFSDFGTNVNVQNAVADGGPYPWSTVTTACSGFYPSCDWLWGQAISPSTVSPDIGLTLDSALVGGTSQHGVNFYAGGPVGSLPEIDGGVEHTIVDMLSPAYLMVDLDVPDLPTTWTTAYGSNVRVVAALEEGYYYYRVYVPAMDLRGAAVLVFLVLGAGSIFLAWPRRRARAH